MTDWLNARVFEKICWNDRLISLRIQADLSNFEAGQFVRVALDIDGERVARPYSLVNVPAEEYLEIYFNIVDEGPLSPKLAALEKGDDIYIADSANGFLTLSEIPQSRHLWMLATGTGVGPFLSILKSEQVWQRFEKVILAYSVRDMSELAYQDTITRILQQREQKFCFLPFVTREKVEGTFNQRIPDAIENGIAEEAAGVSINESDSHVMMCGNSEMISSVTECLQKRGLRKHRRREPGHMTTEKYH